jgi:type II secretory pathway pseudopilin PulG
MQPALSKNKKEERGFGLLEAVVGVAVISLTLIGLTSLFHSYLRVERENIATTQAIFLLEEGAELMRSLRDKSWSAEIAPLTSGTQYYISLNDGAVSVSETPVFVDGMFERFITLEDVNRDGDGNIVTSGGTLDPGTKTVTVSVAYPGRAGTTTKTLSTYLADVLGN